MKSGIGYPSYGREAIWDAAASSADYPPANLARIDEPRRVWTAQAAVAQKDLLVDLPVNRSLSFVALVHHNCPAGATWRVRLYDGPARTGATVYDSGLIPVWPTGGPLAGYPAVRPLAFDPVVCRSGNISILAPGTVLEIGAVEIGQFWEWSDVGVDRAIGVETRSEVVTAGADHVTRQWSPRTVTGSRDALDSDEIDTTLLDFQRDRGTSSAFVWAWDVDDPATYARQAVLVTNSRIQAGQVYSHGAGRMTFDFVEHLE